MATARTDPHRSRTAPQLLRPPPERHDQPEGPRPTAARRARYDRRTERFQHWRELLVDNLTVTPR